MKRNALLLSLALLLSAQILHAQGDVTVRLFSTQPVDTLTLTPTGGVSMKPCNTCAAQPVTALLHITHAGSTLLLDGQPTHTLDLSGLLRAESNTGRTASAAGQWHIDLWHNELRLLVGIPRERYVMAVLSSESAADDPPAALEALAIVIRSFSLAESHRHTADGFDMCDSTHCQAMQLGSVPQRIQEAVTATAGETLWLGNTRVSAYFTQHCGGHSEDAAETWGGPHRAWLIAHADTFCQSAPAQWHAEISQGDLGTALAREGWQTHGKIDALRILQRSASGRVLRVQLASGNQSTTISAASLRFAVNRSLGWNNLRSDWYTAHIAGDHIIFDGKGFGHGVGLCQAGARQFAIDHSGNPSQVAHAILRFYFPGTTVRVTATDSGWSQQQSSGWILFSTSANTDALHTGDDAWARARSLFPPRSDVHPAVRIAPTTELFRQLTNQPGWMLGVTRGSSIVLQPVSVITRHQTLASTMVHEFLHVLVEQETTEATPLWLREGLVEYLADPAKPTAHATLSTQQVDALLAQSGNWQQNETAHRAAVDLVSESVARFGLGSVRDWLRNGVPAGALPR